MNIFVVANTRIPTEKAHGWQIMKSCESLADVEIKSRQGQKPNVMLLVANRANPQFASQMKADKDFLFNYYGIKKNFKIEFIDVKDYLGKVKFKASQFLAVYKDAKIFAENIFQYIQNNQKINPTIISRDHRVLYYINKKNPHLALFYEMHDFPENFIKRLIYKCFFLKKMIGIFVTNEWKKNKLKNNFGVIEGAICVTRHGVDIKEFGNYDNKIKMGGKATSKEALEAARLATGFPLKSGGIAVYTGALYRWKGINTIIKSAKIASDVNFIIVGGTKYEWEKIVKEEGGLPENVFWKENQPHGEVIKYQYAADVFLAPNLDETVQSKFATAPLKIFEYATAHRPMIVSDLPSMRDIFGDDDVFFFKAGDSEGFAHTIKKALNERNLAEQKERNAYSKIFGFSWKKRAEEIIKFINEKI